jgi:hypothetical protein
LSCFFLFPKLDRLSGPVWQHCAKHFAGEIAWNVIGHNRLASVKRIGIALQIPPRSDTLTTGVAISMLQF